MIYGIARSMAQLIDNINRMWRALPGDGPNPTPMQSSWPERTTDQRRTGIGRIELMQDGMLRACVFREGRYCRTIIVPGRLLGDRAFWSLVNRKPTNIQRA